MPRREDIREHLYLRFWPDRHRTGLRVRLLGNPGHSRTQVRGLSSCPHQLEPGDDHDRSGVGRCHVHRATDTGFRRQGLRERSVQTRILPTMGGQTGLNLAQDMVRRVLDDLGIELIGASPDVIERAENREQFQRSWTRSGSSNPAQAWPALSKKRGRSSAK